MNCQRRWPGKKKSNIYSVALCGGKWKKRKIRRWGKSEQVDEKKEREKGKK